MVNSKKIDIPAYLNRKIIGFAIGKSIYAAGGASVGYAVDKSLGGDGLIGAAAGSLTGLISSEVHEYIKKFKIDAADKIIGKLEPSKGDVRILRNIQREARNYWGHLEKLPGDDLPPEIAILGGCSDMDSQRQTLYVALRRETDGTFMFYNYNKKGEEDEGKIGEKSTPEGVIERLKTKRVGMLRKDPETLVLLFSRNVKKSLANKFPEALKNLEKRLIEN